MNARRIDYFASLSTPALHVACYWQELDAAAQARRDRQTWKHQNALTFARMQRTIPGSDVAERLPR
jgi:hypothetical protein